MKAKPVAILAALAFALIGLIYLFQWGGEQNRLISNILFLVPPLLAVLAGAYAAKTYHPSNRHGQVMAYLAAGIACWFIGEAIFFAYQFMLNIDPFPSVADIFYLLAYPLLLTGLIKEIRVHKVRWHDFNKLALVFISLISLILAFVVVYFGVYLAYKPGDPALNNLIAIGYGVGDLILIIPSLFVLKIALDYRGGKLFNSWTLILLGLLFILGGDILFAIYPDQYQELLWPYTLIDLTWTAGYLLFAYSFFYTGSTIRHLRAKLTKA